MENQQLIPQKKSLLAILAPFLGLLPVHTASVFLRSTSFIFWASPFIERDQILLGIIGKILIILISYKCFYIYKKISVQNTILWEILLTFALLFSEFVTGFVRQLSQKKSLLLLELYPACLFIYSLILSLFRLRYQLYLHRCSEKSNRKLIYTSAICIQMLPNIIGRIIDSFHPSRGFNDPVGIIFPYFWFILSMIVSFTLYILCKKMNWFVPETFVKDPEETKSREEGKKALKNMLLKKELLYLFVICAFCGMNENKSQAFMDFDYSIGGSIFVSTLVFCFKSKILFLTCLVGKAGLVAFFGSFFGRFNKKRILSIIMIVLFGFAVLYYTTLRNLADFLLVVIFGKQGISELIHLAVQLLISEKFDGSPEVFFVSNALFDFGDVLRRIIDPIVFVYADEQFFFLLIILIQAIFLVAYFLIAPSSESQKKIKLG